MISPVGVEECAHVAAAEDEAENRAGYPFRNERHYCLALPTQRGAQNHGNNVNPDPAQLLVGTLPNVSTTRIAETELLRLRDTHPPKRVDPLWQRTKHLQSTISETSCAANRNAWGALRRK